ncbi:MAG: sulfite exporter TauE/SafE family protein [Spirochaetales bacterium]|nr:sulfite exporter TauE/SafE family protein [Spirochaetales bacterium]
MHTQKIYILIFILIIIGTSGFSHPLDISITTVQIKEEGVFGTSYLHPFEVTKLAQDNKVDPKRLSIDELKLILLPYFNQHFKVYGKNGLLEKTRLAIEDAEVFQILASGVYINFFIELDQDDYPIVFNVDLFIEQFSTQTNKIVLLDESGNLFKDSKEVLLTSKIREWQFDPEDPDFSAFNDDQKDTDGDGLNDYFEELYGLNPGAPDTDFDGYTDSEEFNFGWDPFDPSPSDGQSRDKINEASSDVQAGTRTTYTDKNVIASTIDESQLKEQLESGKVLMSSSEVGLPNLIKQYNITDSRVPETGFLEQILGDMKTLFTGEFSFGGLLILLVSVFALGFLHAAMPGHGKGILIAYLTEGNKKIPHALGFIITFTITHLIDVVFLAFAFSLFASIVDSAAVTYILQIAGGIGLAFISVFMILKGTHQIKNKDNPVTPNIIKNKKSAIVVGILTGLAPCPFGWAILTMLLAIGKVELVPLIIPFFGLGIFVFLAMIAMAVFMVRHVAFDIFNKLSRYSLLISGVLLFIFSLWFFMPRILI